MKKFKSPGGDKSLAIIRQDFLSFYELCVEIVTPGVDLLLNWHHGLIGDRLVRCKDGEIKRLIINMPPRYGKSTLVTVALVTWQLGHDPTRRIMCASYGQELAEANGRMILQVMKDPRYKRIFPKTRLVRRNIAAHDIHTTVGGGCYSISTGGSVTGFGADLLILDDLMKPKDALSGSARKTGNEYFQNTLLSRLNEKDKSAIIIVMQRLHEDDLVGFVQQLDDWHIIKLPAIAEEDECWEFDTFLGPQTVCRKMGEALHPERESLDVLKDTRTQLGEYHFAAQYQQSPVPREGGLVKRAWLQHYAPKDLPKRFDRIIQCWDTASKVSELNDYSVCLTIGVANNSWYLLDVYRAKLEFPDLKKEAKRLYDQWRPQDVLIEDHNSGTQLAQELLRDGVYAVLPINLTGDKVMRLGSVTVPIENGTFRLPTRAPWLEAYIHELTIFPGGRHDDQVDATSLALWRLSQHQPHDGLIQYYKRCLENKESKKAEPLSSGLTMRIVNDKEEEKKREEERKKAKLNQWWRRSSDDEDGDM
ncbi:phage terminase large subunit [Limibacillus sp. MBR-115]|jgi:predicted phage terminase large subunit-like protein|uniref:phage terminase large subunit n=1 Tax=Limibacillus sp. MBR-115 TaxID=3156465 RepID=UPI0033929EAB